MLHCSNPSPELAAMPLSAPVEREMLHTREIVLRGFRRADGLFDIEAQLTDTKSYGFANDDRGWVEPGVPLHGMTMRWTVDEEMTILACEAATDYGPYAICGGAAPYFERLVGLSIKRGFLRAANERVGGVHGCTHLRELLQQMATVAFQTTYATRMKKKERREAEFARPGQLDTCYAYRADGPVVRRYWPHAYSGDNGSAPKADQAVSSPTEVDPS
jgi:hypothetical protein